MFRRSSASAASSELERTKERCRSSIPSYPSPALRVPGRRRCERPSRSSSGARGSKPSMSRAIRFIAMTGLECGRKWPRRRSVATSTSAISRPESNLFDRLEALFAEFGATGKGLARHYIHDDEEAKLYGGKPGTFTPWEPLPPADLLFYEGLHGAVVTDGVDVARHADLKIGVVPVINLEWIQKLHRRPQRTRLFDRSGHRHDPSPDAGLRELHLPAVHADRHQLPARADRWTPRIRSSRAGSRRRTNRWS